MTVTLRVLAPDDANDILDVYRQCEDFLALGPVPKASREMVEDDLRVSRETGGRFCGILDEESVLVGIIDYVASGYQGRADTAYITLLMVAAPHRSHGVGKEVLRLIESEVAAQGVSEVLSGVQVNNPDAVRFWRKNGYIITSGSERQADGTVAFRLSKTITRSSPESSE